MKLEIFFGSLLAILGFNQKTLQADPCKNIAEKEIKIIHENISEPTISVKLLMNELQELNSKLEDENTSDEEAQYIWQLRKIIADTLRDYGKEQNPKFLKAFDKAELHWKEMMESRRSCR